jgi:hypothetical protein
MQTILKLLKLFTAAERRRLIPIMIAILVMSALEVVGISSLRPFMAVVADPLPPPPPDLAVGAHWSVPDGTCSCMHPCLSAGWWDQTKRPAPARSATAHNSGYNGSRPRRHFVVEPAPPESARSTIDSHYTV